MQLHLIVDNYATHKHPEVQAWLNQHPRFVMHFTLTSASWLNMVERFFRDISENRIRRDSFPNVIDLEQAIAQYIEHHNNNPKSFIWTARADDILAKVTCAKAALAQVGRISAEQIGTTLGHLNDYVDTLPVPYRIASGAQALACVHRRVGYTKSALCFTLLRKKVQCVLSIHGRSTWPSEQRRSLHYSPWESMLSQRHKAVAPW